MGLRSMSNRSTRRWILPEDSGKAPSRRSYFLQHLVFATVIADAAMVERVIGMDVHDVAMTQAALVWATKWRMGNFNT